MNGVKAVYETRFSGPIKVRALAWRSTPGDLLSEVICRVTSHNNHAYRRGELFITIPMFLWGQHRYIGKPKCHSLWQGRPDLSGLEWATPKLLKQLEDQ